MFLYYINHIGGWATRDRQQALHMKKLGLKVFPYYLPGHILRWDSK
jgi:hypothetical protein